MKDQRIFFIKILYTLHSSFSAWNSDQIQNEFGTFCSSFVYVECRTDLRSKKRSTTKRTSILENVCNYEKRAWALHFGQSSLIEKLSVAMKIPQREFHWLSLFCNATQGRVKKLQSAKRRISYCRRGSIKPNHHQQQTL